MLDFVVMSLLFIASIAFKTVLLNVVMINVVMLSDAAALSTMTFSIITHNIILLSIKHSVRQQIKCNSQHMILTTQHKTFSIMTLDT